MRSSFIFFIALLAFGCKRIEPPSESLGHEYFPLEVGKYCCYVMDSIAHDGFTGHSDTLHYYIKETIESAFEDNAGNTAYRIRIDYRFSPTDKWNFKQYISANTDIYSAQINRNDVRLVKLSFPIRNRKTWDENELNYLEPQINRYINIDKSTSLGDTTYMKTLQVDQGDEEDPFFRFYSRETYAFGIGLIKKEYINTEQQIGKNLQGSEYTKTLYETNW